MDVIADNLKNLSVKRKETEGMFALSSSVVQNPPSMLHSDGEPLHFAESL